MSVSTTRLRKDHPQFYRVESKFHASLNSKDIFEFLFATNSTHVLIHYYAQYMYARPDKNFGSQDGFSKQTLTWLNTLLFFCVITFIALFMVILPIACLGTGLYGLINCDGSDILNVQLLTVGAVSSVEFIARVVWYIIGRLDTKNSIFTLIESFDFLLLAILGLFIWGMVEAFCSRCHVLLTTVNLGHILNGLGVFGWGIYVLFRVQKVLIHFFGE